MRGSGSRGRRSTRRSSRLGEPGFSADPYLAQEAVSDTAALEPIVDAILAANPAQVEQYRGGKDGLLGFFVGQVMKETKGQADAARRQRARAARSSRGPSEAAAHAGIADGITVDGAPARGAEPRDAARGAALADHAGGLHYLLIHYDVPLVDPAGWRLEVGGAVEPLRLALDELRARPDVELAATMECAGNGRALLEPRPLSQPWLTEAVGTARWRGVALDALLEEARADDGGVDVVFAGLDRGVEGDVEQRYERSLPLAEALESGAVLAYEMNGDAAAAAARVSRCGSSSRAGTG